MKDFLIGNNVKLARIENELTQQELAERVGVARQTIGLIEAGQYNPTIKLCLLLAKATHKSLDELFWVEKDTVQTIKVSAGISEEYLLKERGINAFPRAQI